MSRLATCTPVLKSKSWQMTLTFIDDFMLASDFG